MKDTKDTKRTEPFAIVPMALISSRTFTDCEKQILYACIGIDKITLDDGKPFTLSIPTLAIMTAHSQKTIRRHIGRLEKKGILKKWGYGFYENTRAKVKYPLYKFYRKALNDLIALRDKMSVIKHNEIEGGNDVETPLRDKLTDKLTDISIGTSNILERTSVAVQSGNGTETTKCSVREGENIKSPAISEYLGNSVHFDRTATENIKTKTIQPIQPITAKTTDTVNTSEGDKDTPTHSMCQAVPENESETKPATITAHLASSFGDHSG